METYIPISWLNDFIFCPYSIYLHQIYAEGEEETFSAKPQQAGITAHVSIDKPRKTSKSLRGTYVISDRLLLYGKIDIYYPDQERLVEYKRQIHKMYQGFYFQIWAQYFSMVEMGYKINELAMYSVKKQEYLSLAVPGKVQFEQLFYHVRKIARFDPYNYQKQANQNKCKHCIYSSLCHKTEGEHVYA